MGCCSYAGGFDAKTAKEHKGGLERIRSQLKKMKLLKI